MRSGNREAWLNICKIENEDGDTVDDYHIFVGGFAEDARIAIELYRNVNSLNAPQAVAKILRAYRNNRASADETFVACVPA